VSRPLALLAALLSASGGVGCSDVFALSGGNGDAATGGGDMVATTGDVDLAGVGGGDGGSGTNLPAACARLSCTPATNEGDVDLDDKSGVVSGCHAYDHLTITNTVRATQFQACAQTIMIGGALDATGGGSDVGMGSGAGGACAANGGASGGGHGGAGADPGTCGGGGAFGDPMHPREPGSGGGGTSGGKGGGIIELAAGILNFGTYIRANGTDGSGASAGGGSGGSVLIDIDSGIGIGRIEAIGGAGFGVNGGGGGGGRVSIFSGGAPVGFDVVVDGGPSSSGAAGAVGTSSKQ
jgi:hypothetical protein